jgi:hypothetical protein
MIGRKILREDISIETVERMDVTRPVVPFGDSRRGIHLRVVVRENRVTLLQNRQP